MLNIHQYDNHSHVNRCIFDFKAPGFGHREFLVKNFWKRVDENTMVVVCEPIVEGWDRDWNFPITPRGVVRATSWKFVKFTKLPKINGISQTKVSYCSQVDFAGNFPSKLVNKLLSRRMVILDRARLTFDKSSDIDITRRDAFVASITGYEDIPTEDEDFQNKAAILSLTTFDQLLIKRKIKAASPFVTSTIGRNRKDHIAWGKSEVIVRAPIEQVLAFIWLFDSRARAKATDLEKAVVEEKGLHRNIIYVCKKGTKGLIKIRPRDAVQSFVWGQIDKDNYNFSGTPTLHPDRPVVPERVRGNFPFTVKLTRLSIDKCKLIYCFSWDMGTVMPNRVVDHYIKNGMKLTELAQNYFQQLRLLSLLDEQDGVAMGEAFMLKFNEREKHDAKSSKRSLAFVRIHSVISSHVALKQYDELNPWFTNLMTGVVSNNILRSSRKVNSGLLILSNREARTIGNSLAAIMMSSTSSELAVEDWILTSPAMQEMDMRLIWFRPMMNRIAMRLLAGSAWGAKFRLFIGAALSIMDMITDIFTILRYVEQSNYGFAYACIAFICLNVCIQLATVYHQNIKRGWKIVSYEMLLVVVVIKPGK